MPQANGGVARRRCGLSSSLISFIQRFRQRFFMQISSRTVCGTRTVAGRRARWAGGWHGRSVGWGGRVWRMGDALRVEGGGHCVCAVCVCGVWCFPYGVLHGGVPHGGKDERTDWRVPASYAAPRPGHFSSSQHFALPLLAACHAAACIGCSRASTSASPLLTNSANGVAMLCIGMCIDRCYAFCALTDDGRPSALTRRTS